MVATTLAAGAALSLVAGGIYTHVAGLVRRRRVAPEAQRASDLFALWWYALGAVTFVGAGHSLLAAAGLSSLPLALAVTFVSLLLLCAGLCGLLYYLLFLFTGRASLLPPLAMGYALLFVALLALFYQAGPAGIEVGRWSATVAYERPLSSGTTLLLLAFLVVPQILAAVSYAALYFRVQDRTLRYRVALVSGSITVWFLSSLLASASGLTQHDAWQVASRMLGIGAALAVLAAYRPPRAIRERYGVSALEADPEVPVATEPGGPPRSRGLPALVPAARVPG